MQNDSSCQQGLFLISKYTTWCGLRKHVFLEHSIRVDMIYNGLSSSQSATGIPIYSLIKLDAAIYHITFPIYQKVNIFNY